MSEIDSSKRSGKATIGISFYKYFRSNWLPLFSAFILGLGFPLWRIYFLEVADVRIEVTEVSKKVDPVKIQLARDPVFKSLVERRFQSSASIFDKIYLSSIDAQSAISSSSELEFDQLEKLIESQSDGLEPSELRLTKFKSLIANLKENKFDQSVAEEINAPLVPEVDFDPLIFSSGNGQEIAALKERFESALSKAIQSQEEAISKKRKDIEVARSTLSNRRQQAELRDSRIYIKVAISNSGRGAISMKPQGFLRVYLGSQNYIDVELAMESYDEKGDLQPRSSKIITFRSEQISRLRESDQAKINTYFKQNVPAILFVADINGNVYNSNTIPFAEGLYQQTVYDQLRAEASRHNAPEIR